jgi:transcriptional regulator with XRE-family HTH domain
VPRKPADPNNPITRLRAALSRPDLTVTRRILAERCGLPLPSITELERGTYRLNRETAQRIAAATGVASGSLLRNEKPLRAWNGSTVNSNTEPPNGSAGDKAIARAVFLLQTAINCAKEAAPDRDRSKLFLIMFEEWLADAVIKLRVDGPFLKPFFESWPDEALVQRFRPTIALDKRSKTTSIEDRRPKTYRHLEGVRRLVIQRTKAEIFCEAQPPRIAAKLLDRLGTARDVSGDGELMLFSFPNDPLEAKKFLGELEKAWIRFAKSRGLLDAQEIRKLTNAERYTLDNVVLFQAALERLAQARAPLVLPAAAAVLSKEKRKNRS